MSRFKEYVRNGQHLSDVFNIHGLDRVHFFGIRGGSVLNPRHLEILSNTINFYRPSHLIVHIGGNDLDKRDDCTELCILKLKAFLTQIRQSCSVRNITVLKLIPRKVTRHTCTTDFNSRVVKANSLLKRQCVDVNFRYWRLRGFTNSIINILSDGVHLNSHGLAKYFREIRGILLLHHRSLC